MQITLKELREWIYAKRTNNLLPLLPDYEFKSTSTGGDIYVTLFINSISMVFRLELDENIFEDSEFEYIKYDDDGSEHRCNYSDLDCLNGKCEEFEGSPVALIAYYAEKYFDSHAKLLTL